MHQCETFDLPPRVRFDGGPVFDAIELAPVVVVDSNGAQELLDVLDKVPADLLKTVCWSIFGHTPGEGVQCIGDFPTRDEALEVATRLFGTLPTSS